jgi:hypothetical protein
MLLRLTLAVAAHFGSSCFSAGTKKAWLTLDKLTPLQRDFLDAFFSRESRFFLTGGAALAGFYLYHRETKDLDLFTLHDVLDDAVALTQEIAGQFNASLEAIQTFPDFRRFLLRRGTDAVVIDLVRDPPEEILANKLCALLSRSEIRDLIDVRALGVLSQIEIADDYMPPGNVPAGEIRLYLKDLIARLTALAFPA